MTTLVFIACRFQPMKGDKVIAGFAICSDADTPITFIHPDGKPYMSDEIWDYKLQHTSPWAQLDNGEIDEPSNPRHKD